MDGFAFSVSYHPWGGMVESELQDKLEDTCARYHGRSYGPQTLAATC